MQVQSRPGDQDQHPQSPVFLFKGAHGNEKEEN
jgi:hypothetical protein